MYYFVNFLRYLLREIFNICHVCVLRLVPFLHDVTAGCSDWINNGCESIKNTFKSEAQWCPQKLPELIAKLHQLVDAQYVEADRAMLG